MRVAIVTGGPEGIRTPDLLHAMEARYQLRHRPKRVRNPTAVCTSGGPPGPDHTEPAANSRLTIG